MTAPSVLHVCTDFWPSTGGIQQFVRELASRSVRAGLRVTVLCFNRVKGIPGRLPACEEVDGVKVLRVPYLDLRYYKPALIPISILRSHDVIHVHGIGAPLDLVALTKRLHRRPIVVSTHGGIFHTTNLSSIKQAYFRIVVPITMRRVDLVAACSRSDAALFSATSSRVVLMENAVSIRPFLELCAERKIPGRFLYLGRLAENKGIELLLRAAAIARLKGAVFSLRLVGPDVEGKRVHYEAMANKLGLAGCAEFVGEVDQDSVLREYELADAFVSASQYEGFGLSAVEAKAAGCKLLLHGNEAFKSLFQSDVVATLVDFRDSDAAGSALVSTILAPRDEALLKARWDTERFSWERKMAAWLQAYQGLAPQAASTDVPNEI